MKKIGTDAAGAAAAGAPEQTLGYLGDDVAASMALVPAHFNNVSIMWLGKLKRFAAYVHPVAGYCENGYGDSAVEAMKEALSKAAAGHDYVESYSAAVERRPA